MIARINERITCWTDGSQERFARLEETTARLSNKYRFLLVGGLSALYLIVTIRLAAAKLIWTDEFFTLYLSRLGMQELWSALLTGGDQHPPLFYLLHHMFLRVVGEHPWALRLPSILGFLLMMLCVYRFVAKRTSPAYGLVAMVMPLVTVAHEYSYEARGYSLLLGFLALAALCWQETGEPRWRTVAAFGLAAGLVGAVASHYYAVLLIPAIAAAELVRSFRRKSTNPIVWVAMCVPVIPLVAFLPLIRASSGFAGTFWTKASLGEIQVFYKTVLGSAATSLVCGLALAGLYGMVYYQRRKGPSTGSNTFPVEEIVLGAALAAAPFTTYLFGKAVTGVFAWRYAMGGIVGIALLFGFFCFRLFRGSAVAALLVVLATVGYFSLTTQVQIPTLAHKQVALKKLIRWLASTANESEPLIIGDAGTFYALSYYSPPAMRERYIYLTDMRRSFKYLHHDTVERSIWALYPWFGLNVKAYESFVKTHQRMMVWTGVDSRWCWLPSALIDDGEKLTLAGRIGAGLLFSVRGAETGSEP